MGAKLESGVSLGANLITIGVGIYGFSQFLQQGGILSYQQGQVKLPLLMVYHPWLLAFLVLTIMVSISIGGWFAYCERSGREEPFILHMIGSGVVNLLAFSLWLLAREMPTAIFLFALVLLTIGLYYSLHIVHSYWKYYFTLASN